MTTPAPVTRAFLDRQQCATPGCDHRAHAGQPLFLHAGCHPGRGVVVEYAAGVLTIRCKTCNHFVTAVEVK